ncbi:glutamate--cysteine ligase catalytic subunit [Apis laboriosa]|uniref:glutamate--cysteine ligase catalytic subunit n=1 Tax=Apis dorsata TaxID=7462 RepID=UPI0003DF5C1E|nr:glutamate--cysteine ligase catalytic subunit [Apis dorsata]XP_006612130.1 glutamate--cysteine ligase catalytic subunit [Apis dorsata]XP_006612131.1 glutamate--cysteine ligase catalytic subunit [Apis dorsata]XP_031364585.1 glutamate--cysteine ligase catalytic subunit [Apis dorsata]XP_043795618.1 glutamate--cysteine ligase catalytic subunit [Apis laboriosa]
MGLLSEGSPLTWEETKNLADHVRKHGIIQFINLYKRLRDRQGDILKWGDEVEYMLIKFDDEAKIAKLSLRAAEILKTLNEKEYNDPVNIKSLWRPEYGAYMLEGTPGKPYGGLLVHFNIVEANMKYRRQEASKLLGPNEVLMSLTNFPRTGAHDFTDPPTHPTPNSGSSKSLFFPDEAIYPGHPRFKTLTRNIRKRRGEKVAINIPIYKDKNVPNPFKEDLSSLIEDESNCAAKEDHIYMDAMGFGMGCCCLQLTFQACNIEEARTLYDQLTPLCPIMLAVTAASPFYRGYISDVDCRWNVISCSVDCRTQEERGLKPLKENKFRINKSRYDSIDSYLSVQGEKYNDVPLIYDDEVYKQLLDNGIDKLLAQHIAHLFIRDTVSLFSEKVHQNDLEDTDHFENIQSTNWQTMRFKPPPPNSSIGWRVEFRPCEVQITDFENAAIVCFIVLLTRVILSYKLNLLIPISKVDKNMARAQKRNAVTAEKFWFRRDITSDIKKQDDGQTEYTEFTINEIINGKDGVFPGLIPLVNSYLASMDVDADTHCTVQAYMKLIQKRSSGELLTTAAWLRKEVLSHPEYKYDSIITQRINYDLLKKIQKIVSNEISCPELLGTCISSKTNETIPAAVAKAEKVPM